ncbi:AdeC/AdeK/OprM family multidrug efflux complex outer membrane factor [Pseudogulbenkiania ferrooxidans]|uniref:RND efflux system, outer membrane lipoprotein, NodT family n=1 Tax=Pseudogulbenkiania ferrooxidans 2002 TaxID=279714 RepID=B9YZR2_9NEIS|nr:AdeC/AdeK/OprM family multidrug efflux complex outer membrane factor [Pseudogulbenkiania ferrooxidans]EEG09795.1 RND efflux system, outer membrane lipoprotein, NodT family [Pseudogulbenkiania ferrooxidans 2002]
MTKYTLPALLAATLLAGCSLAPTYQRPAAPVAGQWPSGPAYGGDTATQATKGNAADIGWREFFADARLQKLIELALANNRDLRVAMLNVEKTRAQYQIQRADLFPAIDATGSGTRQRLPADLSSSGRAGVSGKYSASVGFTAYELDLFGRVQSLKNEALEQYFASGEAQKSAQISLVSEVASQYLTLRALDEQQKVVTDTLTAQQSSYDLTKKRFDVGTVTALDLSTADSQVQTAKSNLASLMQQRAQAENALVLLVGQPLPADLPQGNAFDAQGLLADLPAGLPSDLLERRPDIAQAEHQLKAANADIGAARAAFFPSISLTGSYGTASSELSNLFKGGQLAWSFIPQINLPIFDWGKNAAGLDVSTTGKKIAVAQYEKSVQSAFREVSDALTARAMLEQQIAAQEALVKSETQRYQLAELRYRNGVDSALTLLDAQRSLYSAQQGLIQARLARLTNQVTLYKALGGGWLEHSAATGEALPKADAAS